MNFPGEAATEEARTRISRAWNALAAPRGSRFSRGFTALIKGLSLGDRAIFYALVGVLGIASIAGLYALEQSLLVTVPAYGGTLVEGEVGSPRFINPLLAITDADRDLTALTYAGLMGLSGDGTLAPVLAESYEVSPDGRTYTFTLRKDAEFSDGTSVTAADVVFTVQKAQDPALKSPAYADWSGVGVEAIDAQTVRFTLAKAYAPFLSLTTLGILPAHLWQSISDEQFPFSTYQTHPVGAGPFTISKISQTSAGLIQSVTLKANARYAPGRPYLSGMRLVFFASADELARSYANGAVESAYGIGAPNALTSPYSRVFGVFFNPDENQVYARAEVRTALSLAIDRERIVNDILGGYATPILGPVPPGRGVRQAPIPPSEDTTRTGADTLAAAGWTYDGAARVWKNKATKQSLDAITIRTSNVPELKSVASAVKADWEKLGIPVTIELYEPGDLSQNVIRPRKYGTLLYGMVIDRDQDLYAFWSSQERNDPGLNIALYANKNVDTLLTDARENADPVARQAALQQIEDTIAGEYPAAFLYAPSFTYAVPKGLQGVTLPQITTPSDRFASVASWYRQTDAVWPFFASRASE